MGFRFAKSGGAFAQRYRGFAHGSAASPTGLVSPGGFEVSRGGFGAGFTATTGGFDVAGTSDHSGGGIRAARVVAEHAAMASAKDPKNEPITADCRKLRREDVVPESSSRKASRDARKSPKSPRAIACSSNTMGGVPAFDSRLELGSFGIGSRGSIVPSMARLIAESPCCSPFGSPRNDARNTP